MRVPMNFEDAQQLKCIFNELPADFSNKFSSPRCAGTNSTLVPWHNWIGRYETNLDAAHAKAIKMLPMPRPALESSHNQLGSANQRIKSI